MKGTLSKKETLEVQTRSGCEINSVFGATKSAGEKNAGRSTFEHLKSARGNERSRLLDRLSFVRFLNTHYIRVRRNHQGDWGKWGAKDEKIHLGKQSNYFSKHEARRG